MRRQEGFVPMLLAILTLVLIMIYIVYVRVARGNH